MASPTVLENYNSGSKFIFDKVNEIGNFLNEEFNNIEIFTTGGLTVDYYWDKFPKDLDLAIYSENYNSSKKFANEVHSFLQNKNKICLKKGFVNEDPFLDTDSYIINCSLRNNIKIDLIFGRDFDELATYVLNDNIGIKLYSNDETFLNPEIRGNKRRVKKLKSGLGVSKGDIQNDIMRTIIFFRKLVSRGYCSNREVSEKYLSKKNFLWELRMIDRGEDSEKNYKNILKEVKRGLDRIHKDKINYENTEKVREAYKDFLSLCFSYNIFMFFGSFDRNIVIENLDKYGSSVEMLNYLKEVMKL